VHLNPVRATLLPPDAPLRSFRWSSLPMFVAEGAERPGWLHVDRVFGECGIPQDSAAGRREFEKRLEARRLSEGAESVEELAAIRRGWCFGDDAFRKELLTQMDGKIGASHYGVELQEAAEEKANRIVAEELNVAKWTENQLQALRKGEPGKIRIASRLRSETTMTLQWIAARLHMGTKTHLSHLLYWKRREESEGKGNAKLKVARKASSSALNSRMVGKKRSKKREEPTHRALRTSGERSESGPTEAAIGNRATTNTDLSLPRTDPEGVGGFDTSFD
jgi:hypothetical protein